jgi:hypothetical protein
LLVATPLGIIMINKLLRSNFIKLSKYFAEFILLTEGSEEWIKVTPLRKAWHYLVLLALFKAFYGYVLISLFSQQFGTIYAFVLFHRIFSIIILSAILILVLYIIYLHYRYLLTTGLDLRFKNIPLFYLLLILIYSQLYYSIYFLAPLSFYYPQPIIMTENIIVSLGFRGYLLLLDFATYSFSVSFALSYPRISSNSIFVSLLNVSQLIINVVLISLFISTFVQKISDKKSQSN